MADPRLWYEIWVREDVLRRRRNALIFELPQDGCAWGEQKKVCRLTTEIQVGRNRPHQTGLADPRCERERELREALVKLPSIVAVLQITDDLFGCHGGEIRRERQHQFMELLKRLTLRTSKAHRARDTTEGFLKALHSVVHAIPYRLKSIGTRLSVSQVAASPST